MERDCSGSQRSSARCLVFQAVLPETLWNVAMRMDLLGWAISRIRASSHAVGCMLQLRNAERSYTPPEPKPILSI